MRHTAQMRCARSEALRAGGKDSKRAHSLPFVCLKVHQMSVVALRCTRCTNRYHRCDTFDGSLQPKLSALHVDTFVDIDRREREKSLATYQEFF